MWEKFDESKSSLKSQYSNPQWKKGLEPKILEEHCLTILEENPNMSLGRVKCKIIRYIAENAQIDVNPNEFFADNFNHNDIVKNMNYAQCNTLEDNLRQNMSDEINNLVKSYTIRPNMDFGHLAPDWDFVMKAGISGIIERVREKSELCRDDAEKSEFYECCEDAFISITVLMKRFADEAEGYKTGKMNFVAENLRYLCDNSPKTLAQAMQLIFTIYTTQNYLDIAIIRSLGGLDRMLYPFYKRDIESGEYTEKQLRELVRDFLYKIYAMNTLANIPFYVCGPDESGKDTSNKFTYILLEEYRELDIIDPKIHIMYHPDVPQDILEFVLEMIREGKNSFVFINTPVAARALEKIGIEAEDARRVVPYGCYEISAEGTEVPCTCGGRINLPKILELTLNNGVDPMTREQTGIKTGMDFDSFEDFYSAFKEQLRYCAEAEMMLINAFEENYDKIFPFPIYSAMLDACVECGKDAFRGGAKYNNTSIVAAGIATMSDSLIAIKRMIYDEKRVSLEELRGILNNNWNNYEDLRCVCSEEYPKFGNNIDEVDFFAVDICNALAKIINGRKNGRNGVYRLGVFTIDWRFEMGEKLGATPDGRLSGKTISKNLSTSVGQDKKGVTSIINSVLKIDAQKVPDGSVIDVVLHCSAVRGRDGLVAMKGLLDTFMMYGGLGIQFNVFNPDVLKQAQREPEKYKNLQVRLCGWNVYFVDLSYEEQEEFINQTIAAE